MLQQQENIRPEQTQLSSPQHIVKIKEDSPDRNDFVGDSSKECPSDDEVDLTEEVTNEHLQLWLRRCRRKFIRGVTVIKVANTGKLVKRQLYINAKPEYLELISSKLFDTAYHLGSVEWVKGTLKSPDFDAFRELQPGCMPKLAKSLVLFVGGRHLSLVFQTTSDRLDAHLYVKAWQRMMAGPGPEKLREFERRITIPGMVYHRQQQWGLDDEKSHEETSVVVRGEKS